MRVLVTGAAGFIGSHLCEQLLTEGHEVVGIDGFIDSYPRSIKERNLAGLLSRDRFTFHESDLRRDPLGRLLDGVEAIVNEAAMPGLPRSWTDFDAYVGHNLLAVQRLLEACRGRGVRRFVQASTSSVYGVEAVGDETRPLDPISPYGVTKLAAEHLVRAHMAVYGLPVVILRYFSVYGPRQRPDMAYRIFIEALLDQRPVTVFGDGSQRRSSTYVADCVRGTIAALEAGAAGEIYNIGGGETIPLIDVIGLIAAELAVTPRIEFAPPRPGDQRDTSADTSKAGRAFGYRPTVRPVDGLRAQIAWHRANREA